MMAKISPYCFYGHEVMAHVGAKPLADAVFVFLPGSDNSQSGDEKRTFCVN